jgi:hypothetical protein
MKKLIFIAALLVGCLSLKIADAQRARVAINISSQPDWGPVGYEHADYYYMPDIDAYYDVSAHQYVYSDNGTWVHVNALPPSIHFDRYRSYKVVVNDQSDPWEHDADIRAKYDIYKGRTNQAIIRDSHDVRYRHHWKERKEVDVHEERN